MRKNLEKKLIMVLFVERFGSKVSVARFVYMVLILVAIRLYIRECIIPFDIAYAEEAVKGEDQTEETNGGTGGHTALVVSTVIVLAVFAYKTYSMNNELINLSNKVHALEVGHDLEERVKALERLPSIDVQIVNRKINMMQVSVDKAFKRVEEGFVHFAEGDKLTNEKVDVLFSMVQDLMKKN